MWLDNTCNTMQAIRVRIVPGRDFMPIPCLVTAVKYRIGGKKMVGVFSRTIIRMFPVVPSFRKAYLLPGLGSHSPLITR